MPRLVVFLGLFAAALVMATAGALASETPSTARVVNVKFGCKFTDGQLICGDKKKTTNNNGGTNPGSGGERSCPPGYVVLDKPNKYGALCEPKEGFPKQASPAATNVCCTVHRPEGEGPVICSDDSPGEPPKTAAQIQHLELQLFPDTTVTCKPE